MKRIHKILYSLFGFFICGLGHNSSYAASVTGSAEGYRVTPHTSGTLSTGFGFFCCNVAAGKTCATNATTSTCSNNSCNTVDGFGAYDSATVSYTSVWGLNLYGCTVDKQGCDGNTRGYDGSQCVTCDTGARSGCSAGRIHQYKCASACSNGFFYDSTKQVCVRCSQYMNGSGTYTNASSPTCNSSTAATQTKCYIPVGATAQDDSGYFQVVNSNCLYQS